MDQRNDHARRHSHLATALVTAVLATTVGASPPAHETARPTIKLIDEAWSKRLAEIGGYEYKVQLVDQAAVHEPPRRSDPFAPLGRPLPDRFRTTEKDVEIKRQGAKRWISVKGQHFDTDTRTVFDQQTQQAFDGDVYAQSITSSRVPICLGHFGKQGSMAEQLSGSFYAAPVVWWCDPKTAMSVLGKNLDNVKIVADDVRCGQGPALELEVVDNGATRATILVSKTRPFLPFQVTTYSKRHAKSLSCEFHYVQRYGELDRLASWSATHYDSGSVLRQVKGQVTYFAQQEFRDDDFTLNFPVGANVIEYTPVTRRFWIQRSFGELEPLKSSDYGKLPATTEGPAT